MSSAYIFDFTDTAPVFPATSSTGVPSISSTFASGIFFQIITFPRDLSGGRFQRIEASVGTVNEVPGKRDMHRFHVIGRIVLPKLRRTQGEAARKNRNNVGTNALFTDGLLSDMYSDAKIPRALPPV